MREFNLVISVPDWIPPEYVEELVTKTLEDVEVNVVECEES